MDSSPPFQVEDQTDEDFFDKLVEEEDDFKVNPKATPVVDVGDDSDLDVKTFANLSIADSAAEAKVEGIHESVDVGPFKLEEKVDKMPVVADNSFVVDGSFEFNDGVIGSDGEANFPTNSGSSASGIKEVQWSSFYADSSENGVQGFGSYSDFFTDLGEVSEDPSTVDVKSNVQSNSMQGTEDSGTSALESSNNYWQYQEGQGYGAAKEQVIEGQDQNSSQYWENMYPGWKYDANTGQWYPVEGYDAAANAQGVVDTNLSHGANVSAEWAGTGGKSEVNYLQKAAHSIAGTVAKTSTTETVSNWSQDPQGSNEYPAHMVFDPQYPGWYYDTIAQEWRSLETYTQSVHSTVQATEQQPSENGSGSTGTFSNEGSHGFYGEYGHANNLGSENLSYQGQNPNWDGSFSNYGQQGVDMWQTHSAAKSESHSNFDQSQQLNFNAPKDFLNCANQQEPAKPVSTVPSFDTVSQGHDNANGFFGFQGFVPSANFNQQYNKPKMEQNEQMHFPDDYYGSQKPVNFSQQPLQNGHQFNYAPNRSSAGRPPHALVTFGFGGKLVVMKDSSSLTSSTYGSQEQTVGGSVSVLKLMDIVPEKTDVSSRGLGSCDYIRTLCHQSFPGPLVGGNVGNKELNKWIDERIAKCESPGMDYRKGEVLRLLFSLLKIACQHYGKLRSPFGSDSALKENDSPEAAVAKLFASAKRHGAQYGAMTHCLQQLPSEGQIRATAAEVQSLLVSGKKREALQCAQEGQLWGPALVLAAQLGDQFYVDTVKQMALRQLVAGSPLRTLCLLIAGQPADVFAANSTVVGGISGANTSQFPAQFEANGMLDDWEENLAVITANRTKDDELVLIHLGDCLWKERSMIIAAHICYLVAERNFESYSDSARMCLTGADHWNCPRTYASPEAIQRTELYEYSKVLGNSQYILLPFQPYKLVYAHMLAEVGKVSDSLKYCQSILKSLKTGRGTEVEMWKQLVTSLDERIRAHQQGGYATNLAPAKLVGKLLNFFDSTAHRVVGGLPPPVRSSQNGNEHQVGPRVSASQSTMAISSLMPSASMEPISEWTTESNRLTVQNRSVSEPDFGRSPRQVDTSKEVATSDARGKASGAGGSSRFGRFGFGAQIFQKTVGLVLKSRPDRQAKLGESNKFYYDEKLKRWVEEGAEVPADEPAFAPPPTTAAFQNGMPDYNLKKALKSEEPPANGSPEFKSPTPDRGSGIPPIPPSTNQFSARGRMGIRSRYVDTFNKGGGSPANLFQSPSVPSVKPTAAANAKFFVPTPVAGNEPMIETIPENAEANITGDESHSTSSISDSFQSPQPSSSMPMQRFPSMDHITSKGLVADNGSFQSRSRRTASWSGSFSDGTSPKTSDLKPLGEQLGMMPPTCVMPNDPSWTRTPTNGSFGDDLQEVEL